MYCGFEAHQSSELFKQAWIYFEGVMVISWLSLKCPYPVEYSFGKAKASQLGSDVNGNGICPSAGAMFTASSTDNSGPSIFCSTDGNGTDDLWNPFLWAALFPSISSSLSISRFSSRHAFYLLKQTIIMDPFLDLQLPRNHLCKPCDKKD